MERVLSFGGGLQTIAMVVLYLKGDLFVDRFVFADTGCEKPETYWYIENYIKPVLNLEIVQSHIGNMYDYYHSQKLIPSVFRRSCTDKFKIRPLNKVKNKNDTSLVGFAYNESHRIKTQYSKLGREFPLIDMGITTADCVNIIDDYGWPIPIKSCCYICPYQRWENWNWLKEKHPELLQKAVELELLSYERRPQDRELYGLFGGKPLWKFQEGIQIEFGFPEEYSCWSGYCSH